MKGRQTIPCSGRPEKDAGSESPFAQIRLRREAGAAWCGITISDRLVVRLRLLWERRKRLASTTVLGAIAAAIFAFSLSKRFEATTRLMPTAFRSSRDDMVAAPPAGKGAGSFDSSNVGINRLGPLFIGILKSRTLQDRLIERFGLKDIYRVHFGETARSRLAANTFLDQDTKNGMITITVTDVNADRCAALSNAYVEELNRMIAELGKSSAHGERVFLEQRMDLAKHDLTSAAADFSDFSSRRLVIDDQEQVGAMIESETRLQGDLATAKSELAGLHQTYTDGNVRVREVSGRIQKLKSGLDAMFGKPEPVPSGFLSQSKTLFPSFRQIPLLEVAYSDLSRRNDDEETVYESLTQLFELAKIQEARETATVEILDIATVPERESFPNRFEIISGGIFLAAILGIAWAMGAAYWREGRENLRGINILVPRLVAGQGETK